MKTFLNVMGCIFAALFSVVLVVVLLAFPVYRSLISFAKPSTITTVVQGIDYSALLPEPEELKKIVGVEWVDTQVVNEIMQSDAVGKIVDLYATDVVNNLLQNGEQPQLTVEALQTIAEEEMDSLVKVITPYIPEEIPLSEEELANEIRTLINENTDQILEFLPDISELAGGNVNVENNASAGARALPSPTPAPAAAEEDPFAIIRQIIDPSISIGFIVAIAIVVLLIALCRFNRFGGMLWLGIDALIAALPVTLLAVGLKGTAVSALLGEELASVTALIDSITSVLSRELAVAAIVYAVVGVVFIVGYILLCKFVKTKAVPAEALPAEPAAE